MRSKHRSNRKHTKAALNTPEELLVFEATVRDLASDGRGIVSTPNGETCFVAGVWQEEVGQFQLKPKQGKVREAKLLSLIERSASRHEPPCPYHGHTTQHCGGCAWQFVNYDAQLTAIHQRVSKAIQRLSPKTEVLPTIASPQELAYRNRAQLKTDGENIGFEASNSNKLIAINQCPILTEKNQETLRELHDQLPHTEWKPQKNGHNTKRKKQWTTLDINESVNASTVSVNQRLAFSQGNSQQNEVMKNWLWDTLQGEDKSQAVLELFCGSGNFTEVIAKHRFKEIIAVEIDNRSIDTLKSKNLNQVKTFCSNIFLEDEHQKLIKHVNHVSTLVLDPPRDGFKSINDFCQPLKKLNTIFYISCNLATFLRDAKSLIEMGFTLQSLQPIDLFPQTPHIEIMAVFKK